MSSASKPALKVRAYIDGGSRGNPGPAAAGYVLQDAVDGITFHEAGVFLGKVTNNVAEYQGLLHALRSAHDFKAHAIEVVSDSQLMVRQVLGEYRVKSPDLQPLHAEAVSLLSQFPGGWSMRHVLRGENTRADALANKAMDAQRNVDDASPPSPARTRTLTCPHCGKPVPLP